MSEHLYQKSPHILLAHGHLPIPLALGPPRARPQDRSYSLGCTPFLGIW
jgi:hypothetical protein